MYYSLVPVPRGGDPTLCLVVVVDETLLSSLATIKIIWMRKELYTIRTTSLQESEQLVA